jgi:hypothetical protein
MLAAAGSGCQVSAPAHKMSEEVHSNDDLAVQPERVRVCMRSLVEPLCGAIVASADRIQAETPDRAIQREAILWKIEAVPAVRESLFRPNPFAAVADSWVLAWQMIEYFESGPGKAALGDQSAVALEACRTMEREIEALSAAMTISKNTSDVRKVAMDWAKAHPIRHTIAGRESILGQVSDRQIQDSFSMSEAVGSVVITLDDLNRRMDVYSAQLLDQARWQAELLSMDLAADYELDTLLALAKRAADSADQAASTLNRLAPAMETALAVAASGPELIAAERKVAIEAAQMEIARVIEFARKELEETQRYVTVERKAALSDAAATIVAERKALAADVDGTFTRLVDYAFWRIVCLAGVVLVLVFVGIIALGIAWRRFGKGV